MCSFAAYPLPVESGQDANHTLLSSSEGMPRERVTLFQQARRHTASHAMAMATPATSLYSNLAAPSTRSPVLLSCAEACCAALPCSVA